ncbi:MAG: ATP-binding cassette domain-containing protein, partial [Betaproteobacteria bacterium]|nr:ATP-binding cassette domain-containing protein [Betaproteobacteria bacterium]
AVILVTAIGFLVGIPALRVQGHYLALATFAFQMIAETVIANWTGLTNGPNGVKVPTAMLGPWTLKDLPLYYFVLAFAITTFVFAWNLLRSRLGRALISIRDHETAAQTMGVNLTWYKMLAFGISSAYAALAGGLFAITVSFLDPLAFTFWESIKYLIMVILGGIGTIGGPIIGAVVIAASPELLRGFREYSLLIYYALLILLLLFIPGGLLAGGIRLLRLLAPRRIDASQATSEAAPAAVTAVKRLPEGFGRPVAVKTLLEVSGISVQFGGLAALEGASFSVETGQIKGLIGPNGAGKTTMFNILTRVYQPNAGSLLLNGEDLLKVSAHNIVALGISRTFQNVEMFGTMTVLENVLVGMHHRLHSGLVASGFGLPAQRREEREAVQRAYEILEFLNLDGVATAMATQLPLGVQRSVALARALAANPALLLLDEPASGLSHAEAGQLMANVRAIRDAGITVLLIEHDMRFVMGLCESITVLDRGEVICTGTPAEVSSNPRVVEAYLGKEEQSRAGD